MRKILAERLPPPNREIGPTDVVNSDYVSASAPVRAPTDRRPTGQPRALGATLESRPVRIAVTRAWARLTAPSFW
jgi:hypothetical protein